MRINEDFLDAVEQQSVQMMNDKNMYLVEGLIVDRFKQTVKLTDETEDGVDFSNEKYIQYRYRIDGQLVNVMSIFKRTPYNDEYEDIDGNPFIYALKGINGWSFDITDEEIVHYVRRFLEVCNTIDKEYDVIVVVPSSHDINKRFMRVVASRVNASETVDDMFRKCTKGEALESLDTEAIEKFCDENYPRTSDYMFDTITNEIKAAFHRMEGKYFEAKKMPKKYLQFIKEPITYRKGYSMEKASELIFGKSVLVLDDTISSGASISACVRAINSFSPKKLDVITLLSKKFNKK